MQRTATCCITLWQTKNEKMWVRLIDKRALIDRHVMWVCVCVCAYVVYMYWWERTSYVSRIACVSKIKKRGTSQMRMTHLWDTSHENKSWVKSVTNEARHRWEWLTCETCHTILIHVWDMSHVKMTHVWDTSHVKITHVWDMSHENDSCVRHVIWDWPMCEARHTWGMSHVRMTHVWDTSHDHDSCMRHVTREWHMCATRHMRRTHVWDTSPYNNSCVRHMTNEARHTWEWLMRESRHMRHWVWCVRHITRS